MSESIPVKISVNHSCSGEHGKSAILEFSQLEKQNKVNKIINF